MAYRIFLSYRRSDAGGYAGRLHDRLEGAFGAGEVFRDVDSLRGGERWTDRLELAIARSSVMVVVIGPDWLTVANDRGRRLDDPDDHVRQEIEAALRSGLPLIPALVGGAPVPPVDALPQSLRPLCEWQSVRLSDESFRTDFDQLEQSVRRSLQPVTEEAQAASARRRRRIVVAAAIAAVLAAAVAVPLLALRGSSSSFLTVNAGADPTAIAIGDGSVWVADYLPSTVTRIDEATGRVLDAGIVVGTQPDGIAVGGGDVWVADYDANAVTEIDAATGAVVRTVGAGSGPYGVVVARGSVWVTDWGNPANGDTVMRLNERTGAVEGAPIRVGLEPTMIAYGGGSLWTANEGDGTVTRIDASTGRVDGPAIAVGSSPQGVAAGGGSVWVANGGSDTVTRIDAATGTVLATIAAGSGPWQLAVGSGSVWVPDYGTDSQPGNTVTKIAEATGVVEGRPIVVGKAPVAAAVAPDGSVWVVNSGESTVTRIG